MLKEDEGDGLGEGKIKRVWGFHAKPLWSYGDVLVPWKGNRRSAAEAPKVSVVSTIVTRPTLAS
jgi:hypothetical protein